MGCIAEGGGVFVGGPYGTFEFLVHRAPKGRVCDVSETHTHVINHFLLFALLLRITQVSDYM